jgi:hypothetical protein
MIGHQERRDTKVLIFILGIQLPEKEILMLPDSLKT